MDKKYIVSEIQNLIETINEQTDVICSYQNNIPQIEIDILKVNICNLYDAFIQLDKLNRKNEKTVSEKTEKPKPPVDAISEETQIINEHVKPLIIIQEETVHPPADKVNEDEKNMNTVSEKPELTADLPKEQKPDKPVIKTPPPADLPVKKSIDLFSDTPTITDKFKKDSQSINEKIAQTKSDASLSEKMKESPVADLKKAIGINEKFRFVNELFEGNLSDYNATIEKLNSAGNAPDAYKHLEGQANKYKWPQDSNSLNNLKDLVRRRYL